MAAGKEGAGGALPSSRGRDLLNIQLEVTEKLLAAEEQKLRLLKSDIDELRNGGDVTTSLSKGKELEAHENSLMRIRDQFHRLSLELHHGMMKRRSKMQISRSLPAIGMKQTPKSRPSLFDHMVSKEELVKDASQQRERQGVSDKKQVVPLDDIKGIFSPHQLEKELKYRDGVLVAGSLDALVQMLIPTEKYYPERTFLFAFLLCSRLFVAPHGLLGRVLRIFQYLQRQQGSGEGKDGAEQISSATKFVQLLGEWTETFPYDFRDERMMRRLKDLTQMSAVISPELRKEVGQVQSALIQKLSVLDRYERVLAQVNMTAMEKMVDPRTQVDILRLCDDPKLLAQQLTHIELERLNNIGPEEFIQTFVKGSKDSQEMKTTGNIEAYIEWFNRLSYLVATEICVSDRQRNRVRLMEFFVDTANECSRLNNFNSYMAIAAGLYMSPVVRLKRTRSRVSSKKLEELESYLDPSNNFKVYRSALEAAVSAALSHKQRQCVIPFFSLLIKDLYFLNESMDNRLSNGFIKFEKCIRLSQLVSSVLLWKETVLPYERKRAILNYLMTVPIHTDDELQLVSYETEAPENSGEKQRYQELKGLLGSYARCISRQGASIPSSISASGLASFTRKDSK